MTFSAPRRSAARGDVHGRVAAADDGHVLADGRLILAVDGGEELYAAPDAALVLAGDAELDAFPRAGGEIERLIAGLAQLVERHVLAHVDAALELHAHLTQDVDLGLNHVFLEAEGRYDAREHAAYALALFKHGDGIALDGEVVRAAQAARAAADDGDLVREGLAGLVEHRRDVAGLGVELLVGDELLYVVYGDGLVDVSAGAGVLALAVAYAAADRRERVLLLYELQSLEVLALAGKLDVALHGDMRGTLHLARRRAGIHDLGAVGAVIDVEVLLSPGLVEGRARLRLRVGAKLGAQLERAHLAVLDALSTGDALVAIHARDVVRAEHIRVVEVFAQAQSQT